MRNTGSTPTGRKQATQNMAFLCQPTRYYTVAPATLKKHLKARTLKDVYSENRALRGVEYRYVPRYTTHGAISHGTWGSTEWGERSQGGLELGHQTVAQEYAEWCKARNHTPHPASIDSDHPMHAVQREECPRREAFE